MPIFPTQGNQTSPFSSDMLLQLGMGLLGGRNAQEQVAGAAQGVLGARKQNQTVAYLQQNAPELAHAVQSGALDPASAFKLAYQQKLESAKPKNNFLSAGGSLYDTETKQWITPPNSGSDNQETFYGNPIAIQTPEGIQYGQIGSHGSFKPIEIGQGNTFAPAVKSVDTGTGTTFVGPGGVQVGQPIQKDLAGAEAQKEIGTAQGKAISAAPGDYQAGQNALDILEQIRNNPYKARGTGLSSIGNVIPGTGGYDFSNLVDQAKSGAFLTAIQQMRGLGSLSNAEGGAATAAVTRMNTATSEEAFNSALDDYEKIIRQGMARAQAKMQQGGVAAPAQPGQRLRYNPQTGELE